MIFAPKPKRRRQIHMRIANLLGFGVRLLLLGMSRVDGCMQTDNGMPVTAMREAELSGYPYLPPGRHICSAVRVSPLTSIQQATLATQSTNGSMS